MASVATGVICLVHGGEWRGFGTAPVLISIRIHGCYPFGALRCRSWLGQRVERTARAMFAQLISR